MLVKVRWLGILACLLPLVAAAGCAAVGPASTLESRHSGWLRIVAAFYPLQFVAQHVAGDNAAVATLTQPGAEPHDLELAPRQVASLTTASLVIYERGFQPAVDEAVVQSENPQVIDTTTIVPLRPLAATADDLGHGEGARHDHSALDPHVWLDPTSLILIARVLEEGLSTIDPDHAADYRHNADSLNKQLRSLDRSTPAWHIV